MKMILTKKLLVTFAFLLSFSAICAVDFLAGLEESEKGLDSAIVPLTGELPMAVNNTAKREKSPTLSGGESGSVVKITTSEATNVACSKYNDYVPLSVVKGLSRGDIRVTWDSKTGKVLIKSRGYASNCFDLGVDFKYEDTDKDKNVYIMMKNKKNLDKYQGKNAIEKLKSCMEAVNKHSLTSEASSAGSSSASSTQSSGSITSFETSVGTATLADGSLDDSDMFCNPFVVTKKCTEEMKTTTSSNVTINASITTSESKLEFSPPITIQSDKIDIDPGKDLNIMYLSPSDAIHSGIPGINTPAFGSAFISGTGHGDECTSPESPFKDGSIKVYQSSLSVELEEYRGICDSNDPEKIMEALANLEDAGNIPEFLHKYIDSIKAALERRLLELADGEGKKSWFEDLKKLNAEIASAKKPEDLSQYETDYRELIDKLDKFLYTPRVAELRRIVSWKKNGFKPEDKPEGIDHVTKANAEKRMAKLKEDLRMLAEAIGETPYKFAKAGLKDTADKAHELKIKANEFQNFETLTFNLKTDQARMEKMVRHIDEKTRAFKEMTTIAQDKRRVINGDDSVDSEYARAAKGDYKKASKIKTKISKLYQKEQYQMQMCMQYCSGGMMYMGLCVNCQKKTEKRQKVLKAKIKRLEKKYGKYSERYKNKLELASEFHEIEEEVKERDSELYGEDDDDLMSGYDRDDFDDDYSDLIGDKQYSFMGNGFVQGQMDGRNYWTQGGGFGGNMGAMSGFGGNMGAMSGFGGNMGAMGGFAGLGGSYGGMVGYGVGTGYPMTFSGQTGYDIFPNSFYGYSSMPQMMQPGGYMVGDGGRAVGGMYGTGGFTGGVNMGVGGSIGGVGTYISR